MPSQFQVEGLLA